ncbi:hypothetical protein BCR41DRAFT_415748 [Lobosporangium transversale]|uniref:Chromo domain-containing protein n=1 Tax=Lobosporangium transversale TaxID=64571 RepID=A0A1Y2G8Z9_9FUNG|nr:hypothetical protein BCR41DRAFT_415748 [Lobosporangium transversale]ORY98257.1 hypothetical protein BCR41DRAFT_415748 [Lobosporangium transversale]|eukprot:XP_021875686.1 hypothetical protein BCR41DRAFT_415748 [Lobosporangium transversale]
MLVKMNIASHIHKLDCVALDGGYSGFVRQIVEPSDALSYENFSYPVRKTRGIAMTDQELHYNKAFDAKTFDLQFKLCCLLMNIKRVVSIHNIPTQTHHTFWMQDAFDFPDNNEYQVAYEKLPSIKVKLNHGRSLLELQEAFLSVASSQPNTLDIADETMAETAQEGYEVARILDHRGEGEDMEFLVQWEGFDISEATWVALQHSNYKQCIQDYWRTKISF